MTSFNNPGCCRRTFLQTCTKDIRCLQLKRGVNNPQSPCDEAPYNNTYHSAPFPSLKKITTKTYSGRLRIWCSPNSIRRPQCGNQEIEMETVQNIGVLTMPLFSPFFACTRVLGLYTGRTLWVIIH